MTITRFFSLAAFSLLALGARCQEDPVITRIEFTSLTRGYNEVVSFSPDSLNQVTDRRESQQKIFRRALKEDEWKELVRSTGGISLSDVDQLLSPTSKRAFDGARHSTITIHTRDGKTYTHAFDDEHPHEKLQPLMDTIKKMSSVGHDG
jgi:hypothetical protein